MLLADFDASRQAVINPDMLFSPVPDLPETVVSCFSHVTFERMLNMAADVRVLAELGDANAKYPVYRGMWQGTLAMVGAPSCVAMLEELHALGAKRFVVFGNCGVLNQQIRDCGIIIPTAAMRDEGTSFHYAPPSDEIPANPRGVRGDSARSGRGLHRRQSMDDGRLLPRNPREGGTAQGTGVRLRGYGVLGADGAGTVPWNRRVRVFLRGR